LTDFFVGFFAGKKLRDSTKEREFLIEKESELICIYAGYPWLGVGGNRL